MSLTLGSYGLGLLAGVLSTPSPCVLPLLPIVFGSAATAHRFGALALAGGLTLSFVGIGLFVATIGFSLGLDGDLFRLAGALLLLGVGIVLLSEALQNRLALAATSLTAGAQHLANCIDPAGLQGQFGLGLLLGIVWSPCVGPTMGAAATLASQRQNLWQVSAMMVLFGVGAAAPMLLIGTLSRAALTRWRGGMISAGKGGKLMLGALLVALGLAIVTGLDKQAEALLVVWSPAWLTDLTTAF